MTWLILTSLILLQGVSPKAVAPELDVLVKLEAEVFVGVDADDRWVFAPEIGAPSLLPAGSVRFAAPAGVTDARDQATARRIGLDRWVRIQLEPGTDRTSFLEAMNTMPHVEHAELDALGGLAGLPDDPFFAEQWGLRNTGQFVGGSTGVPGADINVSGAWDITTGSSDLVVATLDSGAFPHVDLTGRVLQGRNIPNGTDNGIDVCSSHGTHVAGIIAAKGDNATGIAGVAWNASILPVVVVDPCNGPESWPADGLVWAVDNGADVVNMSLQYATGTEYFRDAVLYAAALDVPMVAATGNSDGPIAYPARWDEVIAVGASTHQDVRWSASNFGPEIDLVAPGLEVSSTLLINAYGTKSGTSFAAPHVVGVIALLLSIDPDLTSEEIREVLTSSARDLSLVGFDTATGFGCLDATAALEVLEPPTPNADINLDGIVDGDDLLRVLSFWGICDGCPEDLNGDGIVEGEDLLILLSQWSE